jgi:hypothetical protein
VSTIIQGTQLREIALGRYLQGKTSDLTAGGDATYQVFTVAGGEVLITALWGVVDTVIGVETGTLALVLDPTTGTTQTPVAASAPSAADTAAGTTIGFRDQGDGTMDFESGGFPLPALVVTTGEVEVLAASSIDGVIDWYCTWVPLTPGATVVAAA